MRAGDFSLEVVAHGAGRVRELDSGHVLARPGQVYRLRLRNLGPLYGVADVELDGNRVTAGGLVLAPWSTTELERPIDAGESGRFTVVAEGDETAFGPDGGRDNTVLGLIDARFRRELPQRNRVTELPETSYSAPDLSPRALPGIRPSPPRVPQAFDTSYHVSESPVGDSHIERAAGTGLTGHSSQQFEPIQLGPLEAEATVIRLRLVIGSEAAIAEDAPRPLPEHAAPARPLARP